MRLIRTDKWDDATRGEWQDIKRWGRSFAFACVLFCVYLVARVVASSLLGQLGIVVFGCAIVGVAIGQLEKRRSRGDSCETHPIRST